MSVNTSPSSVWPTNAHSNSDRALVTVGYLIAACALSAFLAKRITTLAALRALSFARLLVLAVLLDSFLFITVRLDLFGEERAVLIASPDWYDRLQPSSSWESDLVVYNAVREDFGIGGLHDTHVLPRPSYATSKVFIYLFLMERVHLVNCHTAGGRMPRFKSNWYRACIVFFAAWIIVAITMIVGRIAFIRENDGACVIGLKLFATVPMLTVDAAVNLFLTSAFVIPIYRSRFGKAQILARNSVVAAMMALITSFANIVVLAIQDGKQLSWVCLGSCGLDVFLNACIIFYITSNDRKDVEPRTMMSNTAGGSETYEDRRPTTMEARRYPVRPESSANYFPGGESAIGANGTAFPNLSLGRQPRPASPLSGHHGGLPMVITQTVVVDDDLECGPIQMDRPYSRDGDDDYPAEKQPLGGGLEPPQPVRFAA
ncbi:hypothetical protein P7C70_g2699, partial [Phenoliferia sp. Uapishka_3]